jgi:hypothetical protein
VKHAAEGAVPVKVAADIQVLQQRDGIVDRRLDAGVGRRRGAVRSDLVGDLQP